MQVQSQPLFNPFRVKHCAWRRRNPAPRGLTLVELLVVIVVIAVLMSLLIPAVSAMRAAARRTQCQSNLRNIGHALLAFEASTGSLPAGRDQSNWADHSWATRILPGIEEQAVYDDYDWRKGWWNLGGDKNWPFPWELEYVNGERDDVEGNLALATTDISVYRCPETTHNFTGAIDYGGNYGSTMSGMLPGFDQGEGWDSGMLVATNLQGVTRTRRRGIRMREVRDGQSHTFMVLEDAGRVPQEGGMWANGHNCFSPELAEINVERSNEIYSDHGRVAFALLGDGAVMALSDDMDAEVLGAMSTRDGRETRHIE